MTNKYTLLGAETVDPVFSAAEACAVQLSDGTFVFALLDVANANLNVYYSSDHVSATLALSQSVHVSSTHSLTTFQYETSLLGTQFAMCRDASNNLYIAGWVNDSSGSYIGLQKLTKGSGYTWTASAIKQANPATPSPLSVVWCDTAGTGTDGIVLVAWSGAGWNPTGADGGTSLLPFAASSLTNYSEYDVVGGPLYGGVLAQDGFGRTSGVYVAYNAVGSLPWTGVKVVGWSVDNSGAVATSSGTSFVAAGSGSSTIQANGSLAASPLRVLRYAAASYAIIGPSGTSAGQWSVVSVHSSAGAAPTLVGAAVDSGAPSGIYLSARTASYWDAFADPQVANKVWLITYNAVSPTATVRLGCTVGATNTWAGSVASGDSVTGSPTTLTVVRQPVASTVDWLTYLGNVNPSVGGDSMQLASPPSAPTLTTPAAGAYVDVSSGVGLTATYNSTDGANQNAYALRIKVAGAGSYLYWNAGSGSLQSTIVWNPISTAVGASWTVSLPSTAVSNGNTYNWSMASQEAGGGMQGPFAVDSTFTGQAPPSLVVTGPSGTVSQAQESAAWTTTPAGGASQTTYRLVLYTAGQYSVGGFTPGVSPSTWDSGTVASSAQAAGIGVALANATSYRVYVQVTETGGEASAWQYSAFTVTFDSPAAPTIVAVPGVDGAGCPIVTLTVTGQDNLLPANDASFEGSVGTWTSAGNATVAQATAWSLDGTYCLAVTAVAAGNVSVQCGAVAISPGGVYTGWAVARAAATGRSVQLQVVWLDGSGNPVGSPASVSAADSTGANTVLSVTGTAPAGATQARLAVSITGASASEKHYFDECGLLPDAAGQWSRGGLVGATSAVVTYPDPVTGEPVPVRSPSSSGVPLPGPGQRVTVVDTEVIPGAARTYTATVVANV